MLSVHLANSARYFALAQRLIDQEHPALLLLGDDSGSKARAMIAAARARSVPTMVVQHGMVANPWDYVPRADWMAVFGEQTREVLVDWGASGQRLIVAGASGFDALLQLKDKPEELARRAANARQAAGLSLNGPLALVISSPDQFTDMEALLKVTCEAVRKAGKSLRLVIKLHPAESPDVAVAVSRAAAVNAVVTKSDLWGWIAASNVVITTPYSSAGIEALLLQKPVIAYRTIELHSIFEGYGDLVAEASNPDDLRRALQRALADPPFVDIARLEYLLGPLDGRASVRLANAVESFSSNQPRGDSSRIPCRAGA
jgi:hypothetical protein